MAWTGSILLFAPLLLYIWVTLAQTVHVYLNGELDDGTLVGPGASSQRGSGQHVFVDKRPAGVNRMEFASTIDKVRIYNRALSQAEIQADTTTTIH